ncbi:MULTISPECIES: hypothetical protein [unclassified Nostoc]|nr:MULTISPECIES: hypothetical protein [unclassified Nostoc]
MRLGCKESFYPSNTVILSGYVKKSDTYGGYASLSKAAIAVS